MVESVVCLWTETGEKEKQMSVLQYEINALKAELEYQSIITSRDKASHGRVNRKLFILFW